MRNVTALEFARLYSDLLLVETLPREEVAAKLREIADLIESKPPKLVLHEAYSMEAVNETTVASTTLLLHFHQHFEEGFAEEVNTARRVKARAQARKRH